jgi:hypothetical protein
MKYIIDYIYISHAVIYIWEKNMTIELVVSCYYL